MAVLNDVCAQDAKVGPSGAMQTVLGRWPGRGRHCWLGFRQASWARLCRDQMAAANTELIVGLRSPCDATCAHHLQESLGPLGPCSLPCLPCKRLLPSIPAAAPVTNAAHLPGCSWPRLQAHEIMLGMVHLLRPPSHVFHPRLLAGVRHVLCHPALTTCCDRNAPMVVACCCCHSCCCAQSPHHQREAPLWRVPFHLPHLQAALQSLSRSRKVAAASAAGRQKTPRRGARAMGRTVSLLCC